MTILKSNTINITKLKTSTVIRTPLETRATNKNSFKISATKMTSQTDVVNMTSSRQKENGKLRQGKWQAMNKVSETKERRNLNTNSHFETSSSNSSGSANFRQRKKDTGRDHWSGGNYDKRIRPAGANDTGPAVVYINIMIRDVQTISDVKMEYAIQMTFREQWTDSRLIFDKHGRRIQYLTLTETDMVWMPDLFFRNEKEGHFHNIILPNLYIRIYPDGGVLYSIRVPNIQICKNFEMHISSSSF
ncbi:Glutamate-gated chloride channel [Armadillidium vulgare]|nr:Glutamate-gated chloride channel [Armadillidium vulgare]